MTKVLDHIKFQDYFKFEKGGLKVMDVKGMMFTVTFLSMLYQLASTFSTKEKVDEIMYLAAKRQSTVAIEFFKNKIGLSSMGTAKVSEYLLSQSEISGFGTVKIQKNDDENKKAWFVFETEYFENVFNEIYGPNMKNTLIVNYMRGAISAVMTYCYKEEMQVEATQKDKKYYFVSEPKTETNNVFTEEELEEINKVTSAYQWKHVLI